MSGHLLCLHCGDNEATREDGFCSTRCHDLHEAAEEKRETEERIANRSWNNALDTAKAVVEQSGIDDANATDILVELETLKRATN